MTLHVESQGHGPPLVLLHGWAMHSGVWGALARRLAGRYRVHAADLPGHGRSAPSTPFTLDGIVRALDAAFAREQRPLTLLGWSLGGLAAMRWALARPERISTLVLVCATPRFVAGDDWPHAMSRQTLTRFADELHVAWKATVLRFLTLQLQGSEHSHAVLARLRHDMFARGEPSPRVLSEALGVLATTDLRDVAGSIEQRTLVVSGSRDTLTLPAAGEWLANALPQARHALVAGAAHLPFLSHPEAFDRALDDFLDAR